MSQSVSAISSKSLLSLAEELDRVGESIDRALKHENNVRDIEIDTIDNCTKAARLIVAAVDLGVGAQLCPCLPSVLSWLRNPSLRNPEISFGGQKAYLLRDAYRSSRGITNVGYFRLWYQFISPTLRDDLSRGLLQPNDGYSADYRVRRYAADWSDACRVAAAKLKAAAASNKPTAPRPYLNLQVDAIKRVVTRDGNAGCADFEEKSKPWQLFVAIFERREQGLSRDELMTALWPTKPVQPNSLDQHKGRTNDILQCLRVEICPDNRGIWKLADR